MLKDYPRIGTPEWKDGMQWGWGIYCHSARLANGHLDLDRWTVFNADTNEEDYFTTHEAATDFVRSEIAKHT